MSEEKPDITFIEEAGEIDQATITELLSQDLSLLVARQFCEFVSRRGRLPLEMKVLLPTESQKREKRRRRLRKEAREKALAAGRADNILLECDVDTIVEFEMTVDRYEEVGLPSYQSLGKRFGALIWEEIDFRQFCVLEKARWRDTMRLEYPR